MMAQSGLPRHALQYPLPYSMYDNPEEIQNMRATTPFELVVEEIEERGDINNIRILHLSK